MCDFFLFFQQQQMRNYTYFIYCNNIFCKKSQLNVFCLLIEINLGNYA